MLRHPPDYIGHWNDREHWMSGTPLDIRWPPLKKTICTSCMVRWLWPSVAEHQDGMCHACYVMQYDGMDDIPLERSAR